MANLRDESFSLKPEKFDGTNFRRWQSQMKFWLTTLGLWSVIDRSSSSSSSTSPSTPEEDYLCKGRILSALSDTLYDIYLSAKNAKELWESLETEYGLDDAGVERFNTSSFLRYVMVDDKPINEQLHQFQEYLRKLQSNGTKFTEEFKVSSLLDKMPPSWNGFVKSQLHKQGELTLTQLLNSIRIEDQHRSKTHQTKIPSVQANLAISKPKPKSSSLPNQSYQTNPNRFKPKGRNFKKSQTNKPKSNKPAKGPSDRFCFVCGRTNHLARDCFYRKKEPFLKPSSSSKPEAHVVEGQEDNNFRSVTFNPEINVTSSNLDWWFDSGANVHICFDRSWFSTFQDSSGGGVTLGNNTAARIKGQGRVNLKMTSGNVLTLVNVLYVPDLRKNLVSGSQLVQRGYKIVLDCNKLVITKNNAFIGKGYVSEGLFKLSVINPFINKIE